MGTRCQFNGLFAVAAAGLLLGVTGQAHAVRVDLNVFHNPSASDTTGLDVFVDVSSVGDSFVFTFQNDSANGSSLTNVYFEGGLRDSLLATGAGTRSLDGVNTSFAPGASPAALPGGLGIGWVGNAFSYGAEGMGLNQILNGVSTMNKELTVSVLKAEGATLEDLLDALATGGTRIAVTVWNLPGDQGRVSLASNGLEPVNEEETSTGDAVPTPAAALGGIALLGMLGIKRRR
jgi:hypothetical protein